MRNRREWNLSIRTIAWMGLIVSLLCVCVLPAMGGEATEVPPTETTESPRPAKAYILLTTGSQQGFLPLPEKEDYLFPLTQTFEDGTTWENVIHVTPEGFYMESSNCEGHDCIEEGEVTLENRENRILWNMVVCLPHQITLELLTPEEILSMMGESQNQNWFILSLL